ncbi:MAG: potassium/proton antiporter [Burkholderiaceae bacterium]
MATINEVLLAAGALLFVAILLSALSQRVGVPALLVFLAVGLFATELPGAPDGLIGTQTAALIGNLALAVILLDGGLRTRASTLRIVAAPALALATLGVVVTAALVGLLAVLLLGFDWRYAMLLGAIVGSTDAAAVFALLRTGGLRLNERVGATLEVESGINDPMAVFLTVSMIELIRLPEASAVGIVQMFLLQLGVGLACGWLLGRALAEVIARVRLTEGLYALLIQSGGLLIFATTNLLGGSGFLAIFLAGMIVARRRVHVTEDVLRVSDGLAWLAQAGMFLILGLFTDVTDLAEVAPSALAIGAGLIVLARPIAVAVVLAPFRYALREIAFIGWIGLRGAVPIVLALFPLMAGIADAALLFHLTFFTVLLSLLVQGASLPVAARMARVVVPARSTILSAEAIEGSGDGHELVQLRVLPDARVAGRSLDDIALPGGARVVDVVRGGQSVAGATLAAGDVVAVLARDETVGELEELFAPAPAIPEWSLDAATTLGDLRDYYGLEIPSDATAAQPVGEFMRAKLRGRPAAGDCIAVGRVVLTVRQAEGGRIRRVGLRVTPRGAAAPR